MAEKKQRKLNVPLIKNIVMFILGLFVAVGSALTGIGAQVAAAPMIHFLLGYNPDRTKGTSFAYSLFAAAAAAGGAALSGVPLNIGTALLVAIGATLGAILVTRPTTDPQIKLRFRIGQSLAILLGVFVLAESLRMGILGPRHLSIADYFKGPFGLAAIGFISGLLSQVLQVASGVFLVPALIYLGALTVPGAIGTSLIVIALASLLPTMSYAARQAVDRTTGPWLTVGGALGGFCGGWLLGSAFLQSPFPLMAFAVAAMFLSAWTLYKMS